MSRRRGEGRGGGERNEEEVWRGLLGRELGLCSVQLHVHMNALSLGTLRPLYTVVVWHMQRQFKMCVCEGGRGKLGGGERKENKKQEQKHLLLSLPPSLLEVTSSLGRGGGCRRASGRSQYRSRAPWRTPSVANTEMWVGEGKEKRGGGGGSCVWKQWEVNQVVRMRRERMRRPYGAGKSTMCACDWNGMVQKRPPDVAKPATAATSTRTNCQSHVC